MFTVMEVDSRKQVEVLGATVNFSSQLLQVGTIDNGFRLQDVHLNGHSGSQSHSESQQFSDI